MPPKVVFDTNIYISAILFGGTPRMCLEMARFEIIKLYISKRILLELTQKLSDKFNWSEENIKDVVVGIAKFSRIISPNEPVSRIKKDPSDNEILAVALEVKADVIVSGDRKHLLSIRQFRGIPIITAAHFIKRYSK